MSTKLATTKLAILNPSNFWRNGYVTTPWQPIYEKTKIPSEQLVLTDHSGKRLKCQVDKVDPSDPSRDTLVLYLDENIKPGPDDYSEPSAFINIEKDEGAQKSNKRGEAYIKTPHGGNGIKLLNGRLEMWFNLVPNLEPGWPQRYAGSVNSVLLDGKELLDSVKSELDWLWLEHDPEKRCMQVDQLQLRRPAWEDAPDYQVVSLSDSTYQLISETSGPVRASFTVASAPFNYNYLDPFTQKEYKLVCNLYRVISLYPDTDYLIEEMFVKGTVDGEANAKAIYLSFTPRYFMHIKLGHRSRLYRFDNVPDWLAVGSDDLMWYPGYGFATDVHTASVAWSEKTPHFSWQLLPSQCAKCIHIFMRGQRWVDSWAGDYWYKYIYKPLGAEIYGE